MPGPRTRTPGVSILGVTLRTLRKINDLRTTKTEHYQKYGTLCKINDLAGKNPEHYIILQNNVWV